MSKKDKNNLPKPTGCSWQPSDKDPATVPVPIPVIITKLEGPFTEKDRKLWVFLLHAVWDEIPDEETNSAPIHELNISAINRVFREVGGDNNTGWVWQSVKRLAKTTVEWEEKEWKSIDNLLGSAITQSGEDTRCLRFYFPPALASKLKKALPFARLRVHFLIGLSGKYTVTLYELLESVVNKVDSSLTVTVDQLRTWLKVPDGKLTRYVDLKRFALEPAMKQINNDPIGSGFTVNMKPIKQGRAVHKLRFQVYKTDGRKLAEIALKQGRPPEKTLFPIDDDPGSLFRNPLKTDTYEKAKKAAPGWDVYVLESEWREWMKGKIPPQNLDAAFIAFCKQKRHL